jgi:hypothetical protein
MIWLQLGLQVAALKAENTIGKSVVGGLRYVFAHKLYKVGQGHYGTAHDEVVLILLVLATQMGGGAVLKADGIAHLLSHANLLSRTVDKLELALWEENREGHTRESAACAEVENAGTWAEVDNLGYGQRVEHMMLVELVDILARNDINLSVPVAIEFAKCGKLLQLYIVKIREISVDNLCVHCNDFKKLGLIIFCIWA